MRFTVAPHPTGWSVRESETKRPLRILRTHEEARRYARTLREQQPRRETEGQPHVSAFEAKRRTRALAR